MTKRQGKPDYSDFDALQQINLSAAGVDIGAEELYVAVPIGRDDESVRAFGTFTVDLHHVQHHPYRI